MIEDDRHGTAADGVPEPVDVPAHVGPQLHVPPERSHHLSHLDQRLHRHAAGIAVLDPGGAHPRGVHLLQVVMGGSQLDTGHPAQAAGPTAQRGQEAAVVFAVCTGLHEDTTVAVRISQVRGVVVDIDLGWLVGGASHRGSRTRLVGDENVAVGIDPGHRAVSWWRPSAPSWSSVGIR